jgi:GDP-4-dehydro-6-deoxy-D-mannose reductase
MKILVTGANGFVGRHLVEALLVDNFFTKIVTLSKSDSSFWNGKIRNYILDIQNEKEVLDIFIREEPDFIIHLAANSSVALSWKDPKGTMVNNLKLTESILKGMVGSKCKAKLIFVSTAEVYAFSKQPLRENGALDPSNPYALSKIACEQKIKEYYENFQIDYIIARPFNHIGVRQNLQFVIPFFIDQVVKAKNKKLEMMILKTGNIEVVRDFLDVRDVVSAYICLLKSNTKSRVFNIASQSGVSLKEVINLLAQNEQIQIKIDVDPEKLRPNDNPYLVGDASLLKKETDWIPQYKLKDTLKEIAQSLL